MGSALVRVLFVGPPLRTRIVEFSFPIEAHYFFMSFIFC